MLLDQLVSLAVLPEVHASQDKGHDDGRDEDTEREAVAEPVVRLLFGEVDVGAGDTTKVAQGDEEGHADGALGGGGEVVGCEWC